MATLEEVIKTLMVLSKSYPAAPALDEGNYKAYHRILADLPFPLLEAAALQLAASHKFFPAAAELRTAALELVARADGLPSAWDAWAEVVKSFGPYGFYRGAPEWSTPLIGQAVDAIGGYAYLCHSDNPTADRARFVQAYESYLTREKQDRAMLPQVREQLQLLAAKMTVKQLEEGK